MGATTYVAPTEQPPLDVRRALECVQKWISSLSPSTAACLEKTDACLGNTDASGCFAHIGPSARLETSDASDGEKKSELTPADPTRSSPVRGTFGHVNTAVCESVRVSCGKVESEIPVVNNSPVPLVKSLVAALAIQDEPSVAPEGDREVNSGEPSQQQNLQES